MIHSIDACCFVLEHIRTTMVLSAFRCSIRWQRSGSWNHFATALMTERKVKIEVLIGAKTSTESESHLSERLDSKTSTTASRVRDFLSPKQYARTRTSVILAGKRGSRRHSTTSFRANVVVEKTTYQMLEVLSFCDQQSA